MYQLIHFLQEINKVPEESILHDVYIQFYNIKSFVELSLMTIEDIEHFEEIDEVDIKSLKTFIIVLKRDSSKLDKKMIEIEQKIKN